MSRLRKKLKFNEMPQNHKITKTREINDNQFDKNLWNFEYWCFRGKTFLENSIIKLK
jgi:hypothetical protein